MLGPPAVFERLRIDRREKRGCGNEERRAVERVGEVVDLVQSSARISITCNQLSTELDARNRGIGAPRERMPFPVAMFRRRRLEHRPRSAAIALVEQAACGADRGNVRRPLRALVRLRGACKQDRDCDERSGDDPREPGDKRDCAAVAARGAPDRVPRRVGAGAKRKPVEQIAQFLCELRGTLVARGGIGRERHAQHGVGGGGNVCGRRRGRVGVRPRGNERRDRRERSPEKSLKMRGKRAFRRIEWRATREQVVEQRAKTPHIAARVDCAAAHLLWTHVRERPHRAFGCGGDLRVGDRRDAEVDHLRDAIGADKYVSRLEIAMDHAGAMRMLDGVRDRRDKQDARAHVEPSLICKARHRLRAGDEFHDKVWKVLKRLSRAFGGAVDARTEHPRDVRVLEPCKRLGLDADPALRGGRQPLGPHELERDAASRKPLGRRVDDARAAHADEALDLAAADGGAEYSGEKGLRQRLGHVGRGAVVAEERLDLVCDLRALIAQPRDERAARERRGVDRLRERLLDAGAS